ncbi:MAG: hypothetical protein ACREFX_02780, partial [Opitutaceae bacterium]
LVAVLAVDMPGIGAAWFDRLRAACRPGCGAMGRHGGVCEGLAAIYPVEAFAEATRRLGASDRSLQALARALAEAGLLTFVPISVEEQACFASLNSPARAEA